MLVAVLDFNGDVNQFFAFTKQLSVGFHGFRVVSCDADDGGELARAHLPDMEAGHERIAVAFDRAADVVREIRRFRSAVQQDATTRRQPKPSGVR